MLQCCLNGARHPSAHPRLPVAATEIVVAATDAVAAGAEDLHLHPKGPSGVDTLEAPVADEVAEALRERLPGVRFGFTTGAWAADPVERLRLVKAWTVLPDHASVNWHEEGAEELAVVLIERGIGVEAGLLSGTDGVDRFLRSPLRDRVLRVLVEVTVTDAAAGVAEARRMLQRLSEVEPRRLLLHGEDNAAWAVLGEAVARGLSTRIGFEDTLRLPDGATAPDNASLVAAALQKINGTR